MSQKIDYYFTSLSPFTYLGHSKFLQISAETETEIRFKPVKLGQVFGESGAKPLPERPKCRLEYRLVELTRWAKKRELAINLQPAHFPTDPGLADRCVIALQEAGEDAGAFLGQVLAACWAEDKNIADEAVLRELLTILKFNADDVIQQASSETIEAIYTSNTADAIEQGVLGAPSYLLNGEQFWGQDRLELLADTLRA
jgi:2-hydroxychromene-2-carboxylate isomerase